MSTSTATTTAATQSRSLNIDNINPHVKEAKYAVRGELAIRAEKYRTKLAGGGGKSDSGLPFDTVISANIGNPQQLDQKPITFFRQVASLLENPLLLEHEKVLTDSLGYKQDVIDRARFLLNDVKSVGAYSQSQGATGIRKSVAKFCERKWKALRDNQPSLPPYADIHTQTGRDGFPADPDSIYLTAGASAGVNTLMHIICASPSTGVLVPIPQYPLYTATLSLLDGRCVPYYLNEDKNWGTNVESIKKSLEDAKAAGTDVRAIVVINPGNPTGATLSADEIKSIITFAAEEKLVLLADEVYQTNIFEGSFVSFKKALCELQQASTDKKYDTVELASLHSISKGMVGECGHRGGYMELIGFDEEVVAQIYKFVSITLCPPVVGQAFVEMMVNPPKEGEPSYPLYRQEYDGIFAGLKKRAMALYEAFKAMEGVKCNSPTGSMYLFPSITLPEKARQKADEDGKSPDEFYVSRLLDATGVCMVPGSGFGQEEGTLHFRTTFLAPGTDWVGRITKFHEEFMKEFK